MPENTAAQLEAEAAAALEAAPPEAAPAGTVPAPGVPAAPARPDPITEWRHYTTPATQLLTGLVLPQWDISEGERGELVESFAMILALHFPDGIEGRYAGYFRLLAVSSYIVATRAAAGPWPGGGKLPPLGPKRRATVDEVAAARAAATTAPSTDTPQ